MRASEQNKWLQIKVISKPRRERGAELLPSLQTINIFPPLLPTFLSRVLVADFPPDLLQNPLFKLVREMKHTGGKKKKVERRA